jgi:hypothetical protein
VRALSFTSSKRTENLFNSRSPFVCRYEQSRGYRLVSGNDCKNGVYFALAPLVLPCRSFTTAGFITTFIIVVIAVASAFFCAFKFQTGRNPDSIQDVIDMVYVADVVLFVPS